MLYLVPEATYKFRFQCACVHPDGMPIESAGAEGGKPNSDVINPLVPTVRSERTYKTICLFLKVL